MIVVGAKEVRAPDEAAAAAPWSFEIGPGSGYASFAF